VPEKKLWTTGLAATCALVAIAAPTAGAAGKQRVVVDRFSEPYGFSIDCGEFGPYGFDNVVDGRRQRVSVTEVRAKDGTLLQTVFHIGFNETNTNSETGFSLPVKASVHEVWDYASNTRTLSGAVWMVHQPGKGTVVQDVGRITMTLDTRVAQFLAGKKEVFFGGGIDVVVCAALAAG
jgi:hypothetical protein